MDLALVTRVMLDSAFEAVNPASSRLELRHDLLGGQALGLELDAVGVELFAPNIENDKIAALCPWFALVIKKVKQRRLSLAFFCLKLIMIKLKGHSCTRQYQFDIAFLWLGIFWPKILLGQNDFAISAVMDDVVAVDIGL